jgi:hypothetical protein
VSNVPENKELTLLDVTAQPDSMMMKPKTSSVQNVTINVLNVPKNPKTVPSVLTTEMDSQPVHVKPVWSKLTRNVLNVPHNVRPVLKTQRNVLSVLKEEINQKTVTVHLENMKIQTPMNVNNVTSNVPNVPPKPNVPNVKVTESTNQNVTAQPDTMKNT